MKSVLLSVQPKWVEKILNGKKTIEVRKSAPKELPFKVYVYCTKKYGVLYRTKFKEIRMGFINDNYKDVACVLKKSGRQVLNSKVVAEFIVNNVEQFRGCYVPYSNSNNLGYEYFIGNGVYKLKVNEKEEGVVFEHNDVYIDTMLNNADFKSMCLTPQQLLDYVGIGKALYGWHISDLKIYDEPKELGEFYKFCGNDGSGCPDSDCPYYEEPSYEYGEVSFDCYDMRPITKPPQSWMYVEELCR